MRFLSLSQAPALPLRDNLTVFPVQDYGTAEIADHALALTLSLRRGILLHNDAQREPNVAPFMYIDSPLVARIQNTTFGVLGLGRIGTAAALRAKAFGWNVLFYDPYKPNGTDKSLGLERTKDIKELFRRSTVLSIHCPCTRETRGLVGWDLLKLMPKGSILVNTARGECADLDGVERALQEDVLSGAGLDVLPQEPIPEPAHSLIQAYRRKEEWLSGRMLTSQFLPWTRIGWIYEKGIFQLTKYRTFRDGHHLPHRILQSRQFH
jgi:C-terminal binding protein